MRLSIDRLAARRSLLFLALAVLVLAVPASSASAPVVASHIVQAASADDAATLVHAAGGTVTHELGIIRSVAARLSDAQARDLADSGRVWENLPAELAGKPNKGNGGGAAGETYYPSLIGADRLHAEGIDGRGVTVAFLDSGLWAHDDLILGNGVIRWLGSLDVFTGQSGGLSDGYGHGTHVAATALSDRQKQGEFDGIAPGADLVVVRAFDTSGAGNYADVIAGLQWIVANKDLYGIRVLNLSFSAQPQSYYWDDPLNQAVMEAWRAGIVVVASAGNRGPAAMTIGVPGNVPYIITVGAMTDNFTPEDTSDDMLASFSSAGPTVEAFVKPDLVAPGGHVRALMDRHDALADAHPEFHDGSYYFQMSGTSQAAAIVTGTVALMLQQAPQLTPDEVKYRLMRTADGAAFSGGSPVYSVFQQGAGRVDAYGAVHTTLEGTANQGLDIDADLAGTQHYRGAADAYEKQGKGGEPYYVFFIRDADGNPIENDGFLWSDRYVYQDGFVWSDAFVWSEGFVWSDAFLWSDGMLWSDAFLWSDGMVWSDLHTEALFTESWVPQE